MSKLSASILCFVFCLVAFNGYGQAPVGTIAGTVTDSTGAVVPSATITITNKATSVARTLAANAEGLYSAPALVPGEYEVRAEMQGFRTLLRDAQVTAGSTTTVDMAMTLGATREVVTVEAATAQINYDSNTVAGVIARQSIQDLPLNGRSSLQLASLEPGVTVNPGATSQFNAMFNVSILGSNGGATAGSGVGPVITMDGGVINDEVEGGTSMNFSQEVVQEFQIASSNFDASTGIAVGGAVNIVTRSGSNDFHGSAYFFFRDHNMAAYPGLKRSAFNPNPFFARRNPGAWLGGPAIKDKLFFFFSYEHLNQTSVITEQNDLPSLQALNSIWPSPLHYNWITTRFDYRLNDKHTLFARFSHDGNANFGPYAGTGAPSAWIHNSNWSDQSIMGLTSVLTPAIVSDFRAQYHYWANKGPNATAAECQLPCIGSGLPGITSMIGSGTFTYGAGNEVNGPQFHQSRAFEFSDTLSWQKGSHRFRFGMDFEQMHTNYTPWDVCDPACVYLYSPESIRGLAAAFPSGALAGVPTVIRTTADLLNVPIYNLPASLYSGVGIGNGSYPGAYNHDQGGINNRIHPWAADTWKVSSSLTLNFGLGYDLETGLFSTFFKRPQYLAPILEGQTGGLPSGLGGTPSRKLDFAPQFGFAWAIGKDKKTVIRGGGGLYWETQPVWQQFRQDSSIGPLGDGRITLAASAFTNIFPNIYVAGNPTPLAIGAAVPVNLVSNMTFGQFIQIINQQVPALQAQLFGNTPKSGPFTVSNIDVTKQGVELYPADFPLLHSYQTSLGVQRELPNNMVITVDWARRQGVHNNLGEQDMNRFARTADGLSPIIPRCSTTPDFSLGHECSTGGITFWDPEGRSVYDGLLVKVVKRFSQHYQFVTSYALQKLVTVNSAVANLDNVFASYGPALPRHNLNVAAVVDAPWGFKLSVNSSIISANPVNPVITGIDLNGSGNTTFPLSEAAPGLTYNCFNAGCDKSDLVKAITYFNANVATASTGKKALNGVAIPTLSLPSDYGLGTPIFTQDFRITKELTIKERYRFSAFGEFFNAFNISNLTYNGSPTINSVAFGQPTGRVGQSSTFGSGGPRAIQVGGRFTF